MKLSDSFSPCCARLNDRDAGAAVQPEGSSKRHVAFQWHRILIFDGYRKFFLPFTLHRNDGDVWTHGQRYRGNCFQCRPLLAEHSVDAAVLSRFLRGDDGTFVINFDSCRNERLVFRQLSIHGRRPYEAVAAAWHPQPVGLSEVGVCGNLHFVFLIQSLA